MKNAVLNNGMEMPKKMEEKTVRANLWLVALLLLAMSCSVLAQSNRPAPAVPAATDVFTLNDQANTLDKSEQHEIAIELLKRAVRLAPESAATLRNLGVVYLNANQPLLAIKAFEQSLLLKANEAETYFDLGLGYLGCGKYEAAVEALKRANQLTPDSSGAKYNALGSAYAHLGRTEDAFAALREAVKLNPDFAAAHANLGMLQLTAGQRTEASNSLEKAARLAPNPTEAHFAFGCPFPDSTRSDKRADPIQFA
ncbi:MAG: tetratricopeptide repeat protein [Pyrinomonadaceae bacterium]|nr:tetratricopeptide repeat protein [Pyrinomonadaceae bacterium]